MSESLLPRLPLADGVTRDFLAHHRMCPRALGADGALEVLTAPDARLEGLDDLAFAYHAEVRPVAASGEDVSRLIDRMTASVDRLVEVERDAQTPFDDLGADVRDLATQPPVVRYVNLLMRDAFEAGASDIHLEASEKGLTARFRLDGVLMPASDPPPQLQHAVISRIKLLAELDIAERRRPQDGRIRVRLESRELDLRVSTVPTLFGESVVLRLLERGGRPVTLDELGMHADVLERVERITMRPHGMLLVTGPTGSGKTTTLYAALLRRSASAEKIVTVEDPVEYQLTGITQVPVHRQAGVTFASALRSILRQDPDVVMIGEMRDTETAEIGIQAAMTGHLVFSTLHTNDAMSAIPRLLDLGVPAYLVAATVEAVLSQRLVRRICADCRTTYSPSPRQIAEIAARPVGRMSLVRGAGCPSCRGTGFRGRTGLFELVLMTDALKDAVSRGAPRAELKRLAVEAGVLPLRVDGWGKVTRGITTVEEVLRVTHE